MKTPAISALNETLNSATKALKSSVTALSQNSFSHLYNKEISNKNSLNTTKKPEKSNSPSPEKIANKSPDTSNEVIPNEDTKANDKENELAASPTPETNLSIISLLANANQFTSKTLAPASSETASQGADISVTAQNSIANLAQQDTQSDALKLAGETLPTSTFEFTFIEESEICEKNSETASFGNADSKDVESDAALDPSATKKSVTDMKDSTSNSTIEKKLAPLETQFEKTLEAQSPSLESGKNLQTAPEPVTSNMPNLATAALLSNTPEAITATKTALSPHVGANGWDKALGQKVVWMIAGGMQSAELSLNPPDLGPLQVVIKVSNDQASANFFSAQPEVREALESALPRLRQMLNDAGVQLSDFSVGSQASQQSNSFSDDRSNSSRNAVVANSANEASAVSKLPAQIKTQARQGLIDTFA